MKPDSERGWLERTLLPLPFFAGVVFALFLGTCLGRMMAKESTFDNFERFHPMILISSYYYPTATQIRNLAHKKLDPAKINVIIGGSSVSLGNGQRADHLWSRRLAERLGDDYRVLNLAANGGRPNDIGAVAAEMLEKEYPKIIYVTEAIPTDFIREADGSSSYNYFFYDAYYKGTIGEYPPREAALRKFAQDPDPLPLLPWNWPDAQKRAAHNTLVKQRKARMETRLQMLANSFLYFNEFWHILGYRNFFTVWSYMAPPDKYFFQPRDIYEDTLPPPATLEARREYITKVKDQAVQMMIGFTKEWPRHKIKKFDLFAETAFSLSMRKRTLVSLYHFNPYIVSFLTADEKLMYEKNTRLTIEHLQKLGLHAFEVSRGLEVDDYFDITHISEEGGVKVAMRIAREIEKMAVELGYHE